MKKYWLLSAGIAALATPTYAHAQDDTTATADAAAQAADAATEPANDAEIVVTAQGRRQPLQDVPLAVTAVGGQSMQNSGATDIRALNQLAPSLLVSSTGTEANGSARIRGIGTVGDNPGLESSVAVFVDGVYRSRSGIGLNELGKIERIEVAARTAGHPVRPQRLGRPHSRHHRPSGIRVRRRGRGLLRQLRLYARRSRPDRPDRRACSPSGSTPSTPGARAFTTSSTPRPAPNPTSTTATGCLPAAQLLFEPNDSLSFRLIVDYSRRSESCCGAVYVGTVETFDPTPGSPGDFSVRQPGAGGSPDGNRIIDVLASLGGILPSRGDPFNRQLALTPGTTYEGSTTDWGVSVQIDWDLGGATLTSITAYRDYKSFQPSDTDYTNVDILRRNDDDNAFRDFQTLPRSSGFQGSAFDGVLDWLVGGYFANEDLHVRDNLTFGSQYGAFAACRLVATINPNPVLRSPTSPGCLSATGIAVLAAPTGLGAAFPRHAGRPQPAQHRQQCGRQFRQLFPGQHQLGALHPQHPPHHRPVQPDPRLPLHAREQGLRGQFQQHQHGLPGPAGLLLAVPARRRDAAAGDSAAARPGPGQPHLPGQFVELAERVSTCPTSADEGEWTGTGVLSFKPNNRLLLYASYSRGYKAGGFNLDRSALGSPIFSPTDPRQSGGRGPGFNTANLQFDPETVNAYEIGFKWTHRNFTAERRGLPPVVQQLPAEHVQRLGLPGPEHQRLLDAWSAAADRFRSGRRHHRHRLRRLRGGRCPGGRDLAAASRSRWRSSAARDLQFTAGFTYADTHYRNDLVGRDTGTPLDPALFLLPGDNLSNAPKYTATGLGHLDAADRQ